MAPESPAVGEKRKVDQTSLDDDLRLSDPIGLTMDHEEHCISPPKYPSGVRFSPRDAELVVDYLMSRVQNMDVPSGGFVNEADVYRYHPKDLVAEYKWSGEDAWYFLTRLTRKYPKGKRPDRTAGLGYWKTTGMEREVKNGVGEVVGRRSSLVYLEGKGREGKKTSWKMQEYKVAESHKDCWVLCKVYTSGFDESKVSEQRV